MLTIYVLNIPPFLWEKSPTCSAAACLRQGQQCKTSFTCKVFLAHYEKGGYFHTVIYGSIVLL
jgi:hypothetical protein